MAFSSRHNTQALIEIFEEQPSSFDFHVAVQLLEDRFLQEQISQNASPCFGENIDPRLDKIRIKSNITLGIATSEIEDIDLESAKPTLYINLISMGSRQGPLPTHITQTLIERARLRDTGFKDFLDIFNQRLAGLWYRFRRKYLIGFVRKEADQVDIGRAIECLGGVSSLTQHTHIPMRLTMAAHQLIWPQQRSSEGLRVMLSSYWKTDIEIEEFQGDWVEAPESELTHLGQCHGQFQKLGTNVILGRRVWDQIRYITISVGPVSWQMFNSFITRSALPLQTMKDIIFLYLRMRFKVKLGIKLKPQEIQFVRLDNSFFLGQNTWILCDNKDTLHPSYRVELSRPMP